MAKPCVTANRRRTRPHGKGKSGAGSHGTYLSLAKTGPNLDVLVSKEYRLCTKNDTLSGLLVQDAILHQKSSCIYAITSVFCPRLFSNIGSIPSS